MDFFFLMDWVDAGEALGQSRLGTRPLYSSESPSSPLPTAQPGIPPLPQWCGWGEGCPGHLQYPERPRQGSDRPAEGGSACGLSASLAMSAGAGRADSKWPLGWGGGEGPGRGAASSLECKALPSTSLSPLPGHSCQELCAELRGTGQDKAPRTRSPRKTRRCLVGVLGTGRGRRAQGRPRLPTEAGALPGSQGVLGTPPTVLWA